MMKSKIRLIEKGDKLYIYTPESEKKKIAKYFEGIEGSIKTKTKISGTEFISRIRKEKSISSL